MLQYFHGTTIFTFAISTLLVLSVILDLNLNVLESAKLSSGWSLQYCHELAEGLA